MINLRLKSAKLLWYYWNERGQYHAKSRPLESFEIWCSNGPKKRQRKCHTHAYEIFTYRCGPKVMVIATNFTNFSLPARNNVVFTLRYNDVFWCANDDLLLCQIHDPSFLALILMRIKIQVVCGKIMRPVDPWPATLTFYSNIYSIIIFHSNTLIFCSKSIILFYSNIHLNLSRQTLTLHYHLWNCSNAFSLMLQGCNWCFGPRTVPEKPQAYANILIGPQNAIFETLMFVNV